MILTVCPGDWRCGTRPATNGDTMDGTNESQTAQPQALASEDRVGAVVFYRCDRNASMADHDLSTKAAVAKSISRLLGLEYAGQFDSRRSQLGPLYVVPSHTLTGSALARRLGIRGPSDFFGGVVPYRFVGTKAITHPLIHPAAAAPEGWVVAHAAYLGDAVLPGYTAFGIADALQAGGVLLERGAVRVKQPMGVGGAGQTVVEDRAAWQAHLGSLDEQSVLRDGLVLEANLADVQTLSVGQVQVGEWFASYFGTQHQIPNNRGDEVYGGSNLTVVRGGFERLLALNLEPQVRTAMEQSIRYHEGAAKHFPEMFASRSNYDVAQGTDGEGHWRSGVLEQSWRIGGASGAEIAALHAFRADPGLSVVHASTREVYGEGHTIPSDAWVHYEGVDRHGQRLVKYVEVRCHGYV